MNWKVEFTKSATKQAQKLDQATQIRIKKAIDEKLKINPDRYLIGLIG